MSVTVPVSGSLKDKIEQVFESSTNRITDAHLDRITQHINKHFGVPHESYSNGKANVGTHVISSAYGGVRLDRISNEGGGVRGDVLGTGYTTKRNLHSHLLAYLRGLEDSKKSTD